MKTRMLEPILLPPDAILFFEKETFQETIEILLKELASSVELIPLQGELKAQILIREAASPTSIGEQIALPHVRHEKLERFYIALGVHKEGICWDAPDGELVHFIWLILGPAMDPIYYLQYLSHLTKQLKNEKLKEQLLGCSDKESAYQIFTNPEDTWI